MKSHFFAVVDIEEVIQSIVPWFMGSLVVSGFAWLIYRAVCHERKRDSGIPQDTRASEPLSWSGRILALLFGWMVLPVFLIGWNYVTKGYRRKGLECWLSALISPIFWSILLIAVTMKLMKSE